MGITIEAGFKESTLYKTTPDKAPIIAVIIARI